MSQKFGLFAILSLILLGACTAPTDKSYSSGGGSTRRTTPTPKPSASSDKADRYAASLDKAAKDLGNSIGKLQKGLKKFEEDSDLEAMLEVMDNETSSTLYYFEALENLVSEQYLEAYFREEFAADYKFHAEMIVSAADVRAELTKRKEIFLTLRTSVSDFRKLVKGAPAAPESSRPLSDRPKTADVTKIDPKTAEAQITKIRKDNRGATVADRERLERDLKSVLSHLVPGSLVTYDADNLPTVITPSNEAAYLASYSVAAVGNLSTVAKETDGIVGLSSAATLPKMIDVIFEHIRTNAESGKPLDIAFLLDTTGSMQPHIDAVKNNLVTLVNRIEKWAKDEKISIRLALVFYRDKHDAYIAKTELDFTTDYKNMQTAIKDAKADGGGDTPEAALDAIVHAQTKLGWKPTAQRKIILISDAPGHPTTTDGKYATSDVTKACRDRDTKVVIYPVVTK